MNASAFSGVFTPLPYSIAAAVCDKLHAEARAPIPRLCSSENSNSGSILFIFYIKAAKMPRIYLIYDNYNTKKRGVSKKGRGNKPRPF